jgi:hypothetical protein
VYDEKRHAPAVTATITSCYLPAHAYAANHPQSIYIPRPLPFVNYVIFKASKTEKVDAQVPSQVEARLSLMRDNTGCSPTPPSIFIPAYL